MTRDEVIVGAEELLDATSAWLAVAVVKQRRTAMGLADIRAKRRACIFYILNFLGGGSGLSNKQQREGEGEMVKTKANRNGGGYRESIT